MLPVINVDFVSPVHSHDYRRDSSLFDLQILREGGCVEVSDFCDSGKAYLLDNHIYSDVDSREVEDCERFYSECKIPDGKPKEERTMELLKLVRMVHGVLHQVKATSELRFELEVHHEYREEPSHESPGARRNTDASILVNRIGNQDYENYLNDKRVEGSFRSFAAVSVV